MPFKGFQVRMGYKREKKAKSKFFGLWCRLKSLRYRLTN